MHAPTSAHIPEARRHLAAARAALYQQAKAHPGRLPPGLERAAQHADAALGELDTLGLDVRPGCPEDWQASAAG